MGSGENTGENTGFNTGTSNRIISSPGDVQPIFYDGFVGGNKAGAQNGISYGATTSIEVSSNQSITNGHSLAFRYSSSIGWSEQRMNLPELSSIWLEYWMYIPTTMQYAVGVGSNNKLWRCWANDDYGNSAVNEKVGASFTTDGNVGQAADVKTEWGIWPGNSGMSQVGDSGPKTLVSSLLGAWHQWRFYASSPTSIAPEDAGELAIWLDGNILIDHRNSASYQVQKFEGGDYNTTPISSIYGAGPLHTYGDMYILGYANSGFNTSGTDSWHYIDELKIYDQDPGW